jgi:pimeloyl-ACP methyl ester carboxylesterase
MIGTLARRLLGLLPDELSYRLLVSQIGKTERVALLPAEVEAIARAKPFQYGESRNTAFEWGSGPLVIFVHGWNGSAAQMAPLAMKLAERGYRCVAFDITGNGIDGKFFTRWSYFLHDIEAVTRSLQDEVFAYVGHSSGGTTMMATRRGGKIVAKRYVCVSSPSYPFLSIHAAEQRFNPNDRVKQRYKKYIADDFGISWPALEAGEAFDGMRDELLLIYDERDRLVSHHQGELIHTRCAGSTLVKTKRYGHRRILTAPELASTIDEFLKSRVSE